MSAIARSSSSAGRRPARSPTRPPGTRAACSRPATARRSHLPLRVGGLARLAARRAAVLERRRLLGHAAARVLPAGRAPPARCCARPARRRSRRSRCWCSSRSRSPARSPSSTRAGWAPSRVGALVGGARLRARPLPRRRTSATPRRSWRRPRCRCCCSPPRTSSPARGAGAAAMSGSPAPWRSLLLAGSPEAVGAAALLLGARLALAFRAARRAAPAARRGAARARRWRLAAASLLAAPQLAADARRARARPAAARPGRLARGERRSPALAGLRRALRVPHAGRRLRARRRAAPAPRARRCAPAAARRGARCSLLFAARGAPDAPGPLPLAFDLALAVLAGLVALRAVAARREPRGRAPARLALFAALAPAAALSVATTVTGPLPRTLQAPSGSWRSALILYFALAGSADAVVRAPVPAAAHGLLPAAALGRRPGPGRPRAPSSCRRRPRAQALDRVMGQRRDERAAVARAALAARATRATSPGPTSAASPGAGTRTATTRWCPRRAARRSTAWAATAPLTRGACSRATPAGSSCSACAGCRCRPRRSPRRPTSTASASRSTSWSSRARPRLFACRSRAATEVRVVSFLAGRRRRRGRPRSSPSASSRLASGREIVLPVRAGRRHRRVGLGPPRRARGASATRGRRCSRLSRRARAWPGNQYLGVLPLRGRYAVALAALPRAGRARRRCGSCAPGSTTRRPAARVGVSTRLGLRERRGAPRARRRPRRS